MLKEPTIHQLEELLDAFRLNGGTDAEINALAQDIIRDIKPETIRPVQEVFAGGHPEKISKIINFKNDGKKPVKQALSNVWRKWYIKYTIAFIGTFAIIFTIANLPLYIEKSKPVNNIKEVVSADIKKNVQAKSAPIEPGETIPEQPTLVVPKIGVTAPIVFVETTNEAEIQKGLHQGVVHYYQTAEPGKVGNSFITGHSSNYWWDKGAYNYIFANLEKMTVGDQAKIYYKGNKFLYQVSSIKVVEPTDMSVLNQTIKPTLTLMTCTPPGTSWKRLIVSFDQIAPVYQPSLVKKKESNTTKTASDSGQSTTTLPKSDSNIIVDWLINLFTGKTN